MEKLVGSLGSLHFYGPNQSIYIYIFDFSNLQQIIMTDVYMSCKN